MSIFPDSVFDDDLDRDDVYDDTPIENQDEIDDYIDSRGGIDKCMCCGRYMYNDQLTKDQVCIRPCRNPNEY